MDKATFQKDWKKFLVEIGLSENQLSKELGQKQQCLNRKIQNASIRYIELSEIVEKYGYSIQIHKVVSRSGKDIEIDNLDNEIASRRKGDIRRIALEKKRDDLIKQHRDEEQ